MTSGVRPSAEGGGDAGEPGVGRARSWAIAEGGGWSQAECVGLECGPSWGVGAGLRVRAGWAARERARGEGERKEVWLMGFLGRAGFWLVFLF